MTLKELICVLDEASDIIIHHDQQKHGGCPEGGSFRGEIYPLLDRMVLRAMPTKITLLTRPGDYFGGDPYLEIESDDDCGPPEPHKDIAEA